jgi:hypothetical protein
MGLFDKILSEAKDYHLPITVFVFVTGTALSWFHKLDPSYVAFTGTVLGTITAHAYSPAQKDPPAGGPPSA